MYNTRVLTSTEHIASILKAFALVSSVSSQVTLDQSDCSQSPDQTWRSSSYYAPQNKLQKETCVVLTLLYLEMQMKTLILQQLTEPLALITHLAHP